MELHPTWPLVPCSRHYFEGRLKLLEVSLDVALAHNALDLVLDGTDHLLPDVTVHEEGQSDVIVLFSTTSTAYRLVLPHPEKIVAVSKHLLLYRQTCNIMQGYGQVWGSKGSTRYMALQLICKLTPIYCHL